MGIPLRYQLGWDVDIENLKLIIIALDMDFHNTFACINSDWIKNEEMTCMTKNL